MTLRRQATEGMLWSLTQRTGVQITSFIVFLFLSRLLAPEAFGLFSLALVYVMFGMIFIDQGLSQAIVQRKELVPDDLNTAFWSSVAGGFIMAAIGIMLAVPIATIYKEPELAPVLRVASISLIFLALGRTQAAILRRNLSLDRLAARTLTAEVLGGVVGIMFALRGFGVWSLVARSLARDASGMLLIWWISDWRPALSFSRAKYRQLFAFGKSIMGDRALQFANRNTDKILIGLLLGTTALGFYTIAAQVVALLNKLFFESFASVAFPVYSRIQEQTERIPGALYEGTRYLALLAFPAFIGVSLLSEELVIVLFGSRWAPSIPVLRVLALTGVVQATVFLIGPLLLALGAPGGRLALSGLRATIGIVAILAASSSGLVAISAGLVVRDLLVVPAFLWAARRTAGITIRRYVIQLRPAIIGSAIMLVAVLIAKGLLDLDVSLAALLVYSLLGALIYAFSIRIFEPRASLEAIQLARGLLKGS